MGRLESLSNWISKLIFRQVSANGSLGKDLQMDLSSKGLQMDLADEDLRTDLQTDLGKDLQTDLRISQSATFLSKNVSKKPLEANAFEILFFIWFAKENRVYNFPILLSKLFDTSYTFGTLDFGLWNFQRERDSQSAAENICAELQKRSCFRFSPKISAALLL